MMNCGNNDNDKKITYREQRFLNVFIAIVFCLFFIAMNTFFISIWLGKIYNKYLYTNKTEETQAYKQEINITPYSRFGITSTNTLKNYFNNLNINLGNSLTAKTWTGLSSFNGSNIWTDGTNIYCSSSTNSFVLDVSTSTWTAKTWNISSPIGQYIWTDGINIYFSYNANQYVLDVSTSTWTAKTWTGLSSFRGDRIWTDGTNIYYSYSSNQYVLDVSTSTWTAKTWTGINPNAVYIWNDGLNIYISQSTNHYVLDVSTSTWTAKTWTGLSSFNGSDIWTDGTNIYFSNADNQYVLDVSTSTWTAKTWTGLSSFNGSDIWTDGTNIYFSNADNQYVFIIQIISNLSTPSLDFYISYNNGAILSWNFVTLSGLTQNFEIYKDDVLFATTQNHTYNVTQNGTYKVKQLSNLSNYYDSNFSNNVIISNLTHITYTLDNNITARTYFDTNNSTILSDFYFVLDSNNLPYTIFEIDNNNAIAGYVFKSINDFSTSSNVEFDTTILNNQTVRVDYSSINGNIAASVVNYSATKISGNTYYFYSETFTDNLVIGDYLLNNRPFTSNEREFNNIFVNFYNYLVYDNNGSQENLVYFVSNLTGQYMNNSTYNYYLISFSAVDSDNTYFIQDYIANDDIFFDYYRLATQSDFDNITTLNNQLVYINDNFTFMALFGSIIDAHFNTLKSLLNFQFFGINLWSIFTLLLTVSLVFMALKFMRGGNSGKKE